MTAAAQVGRAAAWRCRILAAALAVAMAVASLCVAPAPRPAFAVEASEMLPDPAQEARARALSAQFRCLVCQNESLDESNAQLAHDLRLLSRKQIVEGRSDEEIRAFLVARYGQFVLMKPRFEPETLLLWLGPFVVLAGGGAAAFVLARRRKANLAAPLSREEQARLEALGADQGVDYQ
jgi:cytochrome c-type biogenesis protein CcmH